MSHMKEIYLDHAATTPLHPDAMGVMLPYFGYHFGLPESLTGLGIRSKRAIDEARSRVADLIHARPQEIIFTSGGTESNNLALLGAVHAKGSRGRHIITSQVEHASVLEVCRHLEREGFRVTYVPVDDQGRVDPASIKEAISGDTLLISIMHANHMTGTLEPIEKIGAIAHEKGITFHVDAAQSIGKIPFNMGELPIDLMTISSQKIYGPKGVGALYVRDKAEIVPAMFGSGQERGFRPGTPNIPGIIGFGMACSIALRDLEQNATLCMSLRESLEQQADSRIRGLRVIGSEALRLPHITALSVEGVSGDSLALYLDASGIIVSPGSPSVTFGEDLSYVLEAMRVDPQCLCGAIRLSLGWENKEKEIKRTVDSIEEAAAGIRGFVSASGEKDLSIFTFPDRETAISAVEILKGKDFPFMLTTQQNNILSGSVSPMAVACIEADREEIGSILGNSGLNISGLHAVASSCRTIDKKEKEFWTKVEHVIKEKH